MAGYGIRMNVVKIHAVEDGIEQVRADLPRCWFDEQNCELGLSALRSYRKEEDEKRSDGIRKFYRNTPLHDWTSHGADAFRYGRMGMKSNKRKKSTLQSHQSETLSLL